MKPALKIALLYAILGVAWILGSDSLLLWMVGEESPITEFQYIGTIKGIFYVLFTGFLLYFLVKFYYQKLDTKVRELEELNRSLDANKKQLEKLNAELEQFFFVASHDLQEPLRMVSGFLSKLEKDTAGNLDEKSKKYIGYASNGAKRMREIILDLLEFSKAGKKDLTQKESVNTQELVVQIWEQLAFSREDKETQLLCENLPTVHFNAIKLDQIFRNLIENAIKYAKNQEPLEVKVSAEINNSVITFCIEDNGIGVAEEYHQKIFELFKRLHLNEEYPGTGLGLALIKKILEQEGCKIWVESKEGFGSKFFFQIPK